MGFDLSSVIGSGIGAVGNMIGGLFGLSSGSSSNKTNLKINREQIAYDREKLLAQQAFEERMWHEQNEYNNPVNQVERLRNAGINPALALQNIGSGNSQSLPSPGSGGAPASLPVHPLDYSFIGNGINNAVNMYYAALNQQADAEGKRLVNEHQVTENAYQLANIVNDLLQKYESREATKVQKDFIREQLSQLAESHVYNVGIQQTEYEKNIANTNLVLEQVKLAELQQDLARSNIGLNAAQIDAIAWSIKDVMSRIELNRALVNKTNAERLQILSDKVFKDLESEGVRLDNEQKKELMPIIEKSAELSARQQGADYWNPFRYVGSLLGGAAAAGLSKIPK